MQGNAFVEFTESPVFMELGQGLLGGRITSDLATIQPERMDACLGWMACISIDASAALVILLGGVYEFWWTCRVTGLELSFLDRIREVLI